MPLRKDYLINPPFHMNCTEHRTLETEILSLNRQSNDLVDEQLTG